MIAAFNVPLSWMNTLTYESFSDPKTSQKIIDYLFDHHNEISSSIWVNFSIWLINLVPEDQLSNIHSALRQTIQACFSVCPHEPFKMICEQLLNIQENRYKAYLAFYASEASNWEIESCFYDYCGYCDMLLCGTVMNSFATEQDTFVFVNSMWHLCSDEVRDNILSSSPFADNLLDMIRTNGGIAAERVQLPYPETLPSIQFTGIMDLHIDAPWLVAAGAFANPLATKKYKEKLGQFQILNSEAFTSALRWFFDWHQYISALAICKDEEELSSLIPFAMKYDNIPVEDIFA